MRRFETKYSDNWSARSGYVNQSNPHARFERPASEPPVWLGTLIAGLAVLGIFGAAVLMKGIL